MRTALLIDDEFPTYSNPRTFDASESPANKELAVALYNLLRQYHVHCDVQNQVPESDELTRIRKTDLIFLDYHLAHNDTRHSKKLLNDLATTSHFNTVILYTREPNLRQAWLEIACDLRGGWFGVHDLYSTIEEGDESDTDWQNLRESVIKEETLLDYLLEPEQAASQVVQALQKNPETVRLATKEIAQRLIHMESRRYTGRTGTKFQPLRGRCPSLSSVDEFSWMQSGSLFLVIVRKSEGNPHKNLITLLHRALIEWRPNYLQLAQALIQNHLDSTPLAITSSGISDVPLAIGLSRYLLTEHFQKTTETKKGKANVPFEFREDDNVREAGSFVFRSILEDIRGKLLSTEPLEKLVQRIVKSEARRTRESVKPGKNRHDYAKELAYANDQAKVTQAISERDADLRLNSFLCSEEVAVSKLTTGTIFRSKKSGSRNSEYFLCVSPACDLVPGRKKQSAGWPTALEPIVPILVLRLELDGNSKDQKEPVRASDAQHVFWQEDGRAAFARVLTDGGGTNNEIVFKESSLDLSKKGNLYTFKGKRISGAAAFNTKVKSTTFELVAQLRDSYSGKIQQAVGSHIARIGVDFATVSKPPG